MELLMGIVLTGIFSLALYGFFFSGVDSARTHESQSRAQSEARRSIDRFAREVRQAVSPDDGLTAPVISLSPTVVELYIDPSRVATATMPRPEKVRYSVVANQLIRESATPVGATAPFSYGAYAKREVMVEKLQNGAIAAFRAITRQGVGLPATPAATQMRDIAQISVRLIVSQRTGNAATTLELNTDVALRNANRV
jgi:hypothetical protein